MSLMAMSLSTTRCASASDFVLHIILPVSPELGRPEHEEWRWVDLDKAMRMLPPRLHPVVEWVKQRLGA